jgi:hypothetical protein
MRDKVLLSYIAIDGIFVITGAIMLGFCMVVQNSRFKTPTQGDQAARDLMYQQFPLTGMFIPPIRWRSRDRHRHTEANNAIQRASSTQSSYS